MNHLLNECLLRAVCVPDPVLGIEVIRGNKVEEIPVPMKPI